MHWSSPSDVAPYVLAVAAIGFIAGAARGFSGFGAAMVFIPVASATLGPVVATPVLLVTDFVISSRLVVRSLAQCDWKGIGGIGGAVFGFPLGVQILTSTDPLVVRWAVAVLVLASVGVLASGWRYRGEPTRSVSAGVGLFSGAMSGLAQIGGPPVVIYWLGTSMPVARMRASLIVYFGMLTTAGLLIFAAKGLLPARVFWLAAGAAPGYGLGMWCGAKAFPLASEATFRKVAVVLIALAALASLPVLDPLLRGRP